MTAGLTRKQRDALAFIRDYIAANGTSPNYAEIMSGLGLATKSCVSRLVIALEERGAITRVFNRARSIALREPASDDYKAGFDAGYRAAITQFGHQALTPSGATLPPLRAVPTPVPARSCGPVEHAATRSRPAFSSAREVSR